MDEKFLREQLEKDNVRVPEKLLPENIGALIHSGKVGEAKDAKRKPGYFNRAVRRWAAAAAGIVVLAGAAAAGIITVKANRAKSSGAQEEVRAVSYDDIYELFTKRESIWSGLAGGSGSFAVTNGGDGIYFNDAIVYEAEAGSSMTQSVQDAVSENTSAEYSGTNIQEPGVDEGDFYKTDGEYIYIFKNTESSDMREKAEILVVRPDRGNISEIARIDVVPPVDCEGGAHYEEMYVDGGRLAITGTGYGESALSFAAVYDISDKANPRLLDTLTQSGSYISSRKNGDVLYLISDFGSMYREEIRRYDYDTYIPCFGEELIPAENIFCPDELQYSGYTVVGAIDVNNPHYIDTEAVMVDSRNMYMSRNAVYFQSRMSQMGNKKVISGGKYKYSMTTLVKFSYEDGQIEYVGSTLVPGSADNQFSFNEHDGYLRLVTTSERYKEGGAENGWGIDFWDGGYYYDTTVSGLYIFDGELNLVGSVEELAPGERVKSSRFIGDMAYIVTFRQTDPLFAIDASNSEAPEVMSELKISGFSEYMHPYGEGKMLGIGYEADEQTGRAECIKISMFDISDSSDVTEESRLLLPEADYAGVIQDHKALLISAERNLFGFAVTCADIDAAGYWQGSHIEYRLFDYDEEQGFKELLSCSLKSGGSASSYENYVCNGYPRALYIGDYLYIIGDGCSIKSYSLTDYSYIASWAE